MNLENFTFGGRPPQKKRSFLGTFPLLPTQVSRFHFSTQLKPFDMKNLAPLFAFLLVCISSAFTTAHPVANNFAHVDYFLKLDGVDGESADKDHKKWIEIESMQINRAGQTISIQRTQTSKSSAKIQEACASGKHFKKAILHVRKSGDDNYMQIELENVPPSVARPAGSRSRRRRAGPTGRHRRVHRP